jgi:hypothetical protein
VNLDRRVRDGEGPLSESERDELDRRRKEDAKPEMERYVLRRWAPSGSRKLCGGKPGGADRGAEGRVRHPDGGVVPGVGRVTGVVFKWRKGDRSPGRKRRAALAAMIGYLFAQHHDTYRSPLITAYLRALGWAVSKNIVAALTAQQNLVAPHTPGGAA